MEASEVQLVFSICQVQVFCPTRGLFLLTNEQKFTFLYWPHAGVKVISFFSIAFPQFHLHLHKNSRPIAALPRRNIRNLVMDHFLVHPSIVDVKSSRWTWLTIATLQIQAKKKSHFRSFGCFLFISF